MEKDLSNSSLELAVEAYDFHQPMDAVWRSMSFHSTYLQSFENVHYYLLNGDGPLSQAERHYIAMMAASRYSCTELISHHSKELTSSLFPRPGVHIQKWMDSGFALDKAPKKLQQLHNINILLAHRPWMISKLHIQELVKGDGGRNKWSLCELAQAMTILSHFHAFSSYILGCGTMNNNNHVVEDEPADPDPISFSVRLSPVKCKKSADGSVSPKKVAIHVPRIVKKMASMNGHYEEPELAELGQRFERIDVVEHCLEQYGSDITELEMIDDVIDPSKFTKDLEFQYTDFAKREHPRSYPTLKSTVFCWKDHGYYILERFYNEDIAHLLDQKFQTINKLTYHNLGDYQSVDTRHFRRAIQCYIQCLYGIRHDDYNYRNVNELLHIPLKKYIKTLSCFPKLCRADDYSEVMGDFRDSEKVHLCLLVCESKFKSGLIYSLKAVTDYFC
jgi:sestrin